MWYNRLELGSSRYPWDRVYGPSATVPTESLCFWLSLAPMAHPFQVTI